MGRDHLLNDVNVGGREWFASADDMSDGLGVIAAALLRVADAIDRQTEVLARMAGLDIDVSANGGGSKTEAGSR